MTANIESSPKSAIGPVEENQRIEIIDVLRGFALFGVLLVNIHLFNSPVQMAALPPDPATPFIDRAAAWFIRLIAEGKFYSLFSLLFGLGLTIQMGRAERRNVSFVPIYARRLAILMAIGLLHALLFWTGDILMLYAVLGFALIPYRKVRPRLLLLWAAVMLAVLVSVSVFSFLLFEIGRSSPEFVKETNQFLAEQEAANRSDAEQARLVYSTGSFAEITAQRSRDLYLMIFANLSIAPQVFAMFLVGVYFGRKQIFQNLNEHLPFLKKLFWWGLAIGVPCNLAFATISQSLTPTEPSPAMLLVLALQAVGVPALMLFYVTGLIRLSRRAGWQRRLRPFAALGQMALTNYLLQSVICTFIFYGYGLGLFGQAGQAAGLLLAVTIYSFQLVLSNWWMQKSRIGPVEWMWRSLTYGRPQPLLRKEAALHIQRSRLT